MTASLFGSRYFGRQAAWHNMGVVMNERVSATEAVALARLDYQVFTTQSYFKLENPRLEPFVIEGQVEIEPIVDVTYTEYPVSDTMAIYRTPTIDDPCVRSFGTASKGYTIVQNTDLAKILDPMTEHWPVETAGALKMGEVVWFLLDMGAGIIAGEEHRRFAWVRDSKTPGLGLMMKPVRTRVVCANTDAIALNEKGVTISLRHTADVQSRFEEIIKAMDQLREQNRLDEEALEALASYAVSQEEVDQVIAKAYPISEPPKFRTLNGKPSEKQEAMLRAYDLLNKRMTEYRVGAQDAYETLCIQFPRIAKSGYAVYNAVLENEDHRRYTAANAVSAFFGQGYKVKAVAKKELLMLVG